MKCWEFSSDPLANIQNNCENTTHQEMCLMMSTGGTFFSKIPIHDYLITIWISLPVYARRKVKVQDRNFRGFSRRSRNTITANDWLTRPFRGSVRQWLEVPNSETDYHTWALGSDHHSNNKGMSHNCLFNNTRCLSRHITPLAYCLLYDGGRGLKSCLGLSRRWAGKFVCYQRKKNLCIRLLCRFPFACWRNTCTWPATLSLV